MNVLMALLLGIALVTSSNVTLAASAKTTGQRPPAAANPNSTQNQTQNNTPSTTDAAPDKPDKAVDKKIDNKPVRPTPRGGKYYVNAKGKRVYVPNNSPQKGQN